MKFTIQEAYIILKNIEARNQWLEDNPDDSSEIENESEIIPKILDKFYGVKI
jgi:hypothetical protein